MLSTELGANVRCILHERMISYRLTVKSRTNVQPLMIMMLMMMIIMTMEEEGEPKLVHQ